jgi:hypothetical protein
VVGSSFDQLVLEGQFGKTSQLVAVSFFRVATDNVVGLLLSFIHSESLKASFPLLNILSSWSLKVVIPYFLLHSCRSFVIPVDRWQLITFHLLLGI